MFQNKTVKTLAILVIGLCWFISLGWSLNSYTKTQATQNTVAKIQTSEINITSNQDPTETHDFAEQEYPNIEFLNNTIGFNDPITNQTENPAPSVSDNQTELKPAPNSTIPIRPSTGEKVPTSDKTGTPNSLDFTGLGINSPIIFATMGDIFETNPDGSINTSKPIQENLKNGPLSTPVQRLLTKGVVHLPFTPNSGEFGNSYIIGHSSNYASVKSVYNDIFKNLNKAKIGDEFTIYNSEGKGMIFRVFESLVVNTGDVDKAYQNFDSRRVVTLQASVLVGGKPLKRLLVRGELTN